MLISALLTEDWVTAWDSVDAVFPDFNPVFADFKPVVVKVFMREACFPCAWVLPVSVAVSLVVTAEVVTAEEDEKDVAFENLDFRDFPAVGSGVTITAGTVDRVFPRV